jgi:mono/diheme cytochrome c family protein
VDREERDRLIQEHLEAIRRISAPPAAGATERAWPPDGFYLLWHVVVGAMLGLVGALVSLGANVLGAPLFGQRPLELIRVYLTFPMGQRALEAEQGLVLFVGCALYLATGALYGVGFHLLMSLRFADASRARRLLAATALGLGLWIVNFYLILSWLQPLLLGGNWIVRLVPFWVAALTHLAFAWTIVACETWGRFEPYRGTAMLAASLLVLGGARCGPAATAPAAVAGEAAVAEPAAGAAPTSLYERWRTVPPGEHDAYNQRASLIHRGEAVYRKYCVGCHGERGDGQGPAAERLLTRPRDFTSGIYKFRSTDSGSLPLDSDLYRTISRGLARVGMPAFPLLPEREKVAVIEYLKTLYPRWEEEQDRRTIVPVPRAPADLADPERILRGRVVYVEMECGQCHGIDGQGQGATRTEYVDAWGHPQKPFNFARGALKGGNQPEDIYRTFHTGLQSIMPAYGGDTLALASAESFEAKRAALLAEELERLRTVLDAFPRNAEALNALDEGERLSLAGRNSWDLVAYILSLRTSTTTAEAVLGPAAAEARASR